MVSIDKRKIISIIIYILKLEDILEDMMNIKKFYEAMNSGYGFLCLSKSLDYEYKIRGDIPKLKLYQLLFF